jgi:hypothetical protein
MKSILHTEFTIPTAYIGLTAPAVYYPEKQHKGGGSNVYISSTERRGRVLNTPA